MINSIFLSIYREQKNKNLGNFEFNNSAVINSNQNNFDYKIDSKILLNYAEKFSFYDDICNLIQTFITKMNSTYELKRENPETCGKFIELLMKKYSKLKDEHLNIVKKINDAVKNKKICYK